MRLFAGAWPIFSGGPPKEIPATRPPISTRGSKRLGEEFGGLPPGNLLALFDEIRRLYPPIYEEFQAARNSALDQLFEQAVAVASRERAIREGINLQVVKGMFRTLMMGLLESPTLIVANVPYADICQTVTMVLRHGVLKGPVDRSVAQHPAAKGSEDIQHAWPARVKG